MPMIRFLGLFAVVTAWLAPAAVHAVVPPNADLLPVCVAAVQAGDTPETIVQAPAERMTCGEQQRKLGPGDYWAVSGPLDRTSTAADPLTIRIASLWQGDIALTVLYADGRRVTQSLTNRDISRHIELGALIGWTIPAHDAPVRRLVWRVDDSANMRGVLVGAHVMTREEARRGSLQMAAVYAGFAGLAIALIVYNLAMWGALRHRFQLLYCMMVALLLGYTLSSSGLLAWAVPDIANNDRIRFNHFFLAASASAALFFARSYFEPRVMDGWLSRIQLIVSGLLILVGVGFTPLSHWSIHLADRLYTLSFGAVMLLAGMMLWASWARRSRYRWMFALAWAMPILSGTTRTMINLGLLPWNFWADNSTIIAMAAESLLSSLAIAYRIHLLSRERDAARAGAIAAQLLADTDPLTGLLNRRSFLSRAIGRPGEQQMMIIDIDHFKRVNDTLGHDGGDEVLRVFARMLREVAGQGSLAARIGGEEFVLVQDAASAISPDAVLDRLRAARMPFDLTVTASIGCCTGPLSDEKDWKSLYRRADRALFDAKAAGRDRVRSALGAAA